MRRGELTLAGHRIRCFDSDMPHDFTFTPAMSLFVECESAAEFDVVFTELARTGSVLMTPDDYGFSRRFVWVNDRYGVSWQLNVDDRRPRVRRRSPTSRALRVSPMSPMSPDA